jgi:hypothetical protein
METKKDQIPKMFPQECTFFSIFMEKGKRGSQLAQPRVDPETVD